MPVPQNYSNLQVALHWVIATLIVFQLVVNEPMQDAFRDRLDGQASESMAGALLHAGIGLTILALAIVRAFVRYRVGVPAAAEDVPGVFVWLGHSTHFLLYGFLFFMPISGAIAWFGGVEMSGVLHELGRLILVPAILFHVAGALVEHFVFRSESLRRMLRLGRSRGGGEGAHGAPGTK